jgi:serine protease AprX
MYGVNAANGAEEDPDVRLDCGKTSGSGPSPRRGRLALVGLVASLAVALVAPTAAHADALLSRGLARKLSGNPHGTFKVIVQAEAGTSTADLNAEVWDEIRDRPARRTRVTRRFDALNTVVAQLSRRQILELARSDEILAISLDAPVKLTDGGSTLTSDQRWPYVAKVNRFWSETSSSGSGSGLSVPTIAIVDSGVDRQRADFGSRVVREVVLTASTPNSPGDGRGHGTMVASIAAGSAAEYAGAAPTANIVSLDVTNDLGTGLTSDVIAAVNWILQNKSQYGIRVANFSLHGAQRSTFRFDPLNKAVEKLWFSGVVVVAAAGNYGAVESGVLYSPANDPFVITVGANDIAGTTSANDDFAAPWSAYGYTLDGFAKPELSAPGRYLVGAVSGNSTMAAERPDRIVAPGYMLMSGTSFAAPVVAGAAALVLAHHPTWTPDQVKGALMLTARATPLSPAGASGVGEVHASAAANVLTPPNPNLSLNQFLVPDLLGGIPVFNDATWTSAAQASATWDAATWTSATWTSATWTSATWTSASWTAATWTSATWTSATWTSATWTSATWTSGDLSLTASPEADAHPANGEWISAAELAAEAAELP